MKKIMFAGGGTGGHLFPAFALAEEFKRRLPDDCEIRFFVTGRDIEMKLISSRGYGTTRIHVRGLKRGTLVGNAMFFPVLFFGIIEAIAKVISYDPKLVVGTGGYLSFRPYSPPKSPIARPLFRNKTHTPASPRRNWRVSPI